MKKTVLIILFYFFSNYAFSCVCGIETLIERFQKSDFVAKVKIVKITTIENDFDYQDAEIEILELYKGETRQTIKILYAINSSCAFNVQENSTWLVFADTHDGKLSFGFCSGSKQIDRNFDTNEYPNAQKYQNQSIQRQLSILTILKEIRVTTFNENGLWLLRSKKCDSDFKGYEVNDNTALYEITISTNLKIKKVKALKEFDNADLSKAILKCLSNNFIIGNEKIKKIPKKTKIYVAYVYYKNDNPNESFMTEIDL
ncbi:hypothetical protein BXU11_07585 [Flavobacterium sp. LM5]|uniref:hypothetical protein n=1 Tax=Flavobacterium sp. LM5 TaxID=1938610 RepID=UPI000991D61D|nr:hypothetical protein [Flavobacterium sp. LM5]OOV29723.1 hypothetical protein BXU11_07585 [Flavobacterium sp. LM5]